MNSRNSSIPEGFWSPHFWTSKDGTTVAISAMEDRHIFKTLKFLYEKSENDIRQGLLRVAEDLESNLGFADERVQKLRDAANSGTIREARIAFTPQIPHLEAEAELRGIKGWRYLMADKEVHRSLGKVLGGATKIVKTYKSLGHNPNVPIKTEIESIVNAVELLEKAGYRFESCPR